MKNRQQRNRVRDGHLRARHTREDAHHAKSAVIHGVLSVNSRAVGFIADEKHKEDVMIETQNLATALNRDEVEVEMLKGRVRGRRTGRVVRIVKRAKTRFVGTIEERTVSIPPFVKAARRLAGGEVPSRRGGGFQPPLNPLLRKGGEEVPHPSGPLPLRKGELKHQLVVVPDDFRMYAPIEIPRNRRGIEHGTDVELKPGRKALVEIKEWKIGKEPQGEIIRVIGKKGEHEVEMQSIVLERGFETVFPHEVEQEAKRIEKGISSEEIARRRDFRSHTLFTIDPANAKDFDDALSFRKLSDSEVKDKGLRIKDSMYEIGIHIADVSHYVREGTALDREARERGTSVYLVDRTIPMLPHVLSNNLCSLNERVDRLAFSAVFEMDMHGKVFNRWFGKSIIHSKKRFTYEEAQALINGSTRSDLFPDTRSDLVEGLWTLNAIAKKLRAEKMKKGAIDFEHDEVGFELDKGGHPIRVFKKVRLDTHKLVEEFMLLANREVAEFLWKASKESGVPFIYRIHDVPDREKITQLRVFVHALGHELPIGKGGKVHGKDLQQLFQKIEGKAEESLIKTAAIRSMAKAVYSTQNIGHFGLAFEYYTHFTSPIRRYPDLMVHRLLHAVLKRHTLEPEKLARLERIADNATQKEIAAAEAERESIKLKQVEFMQDFLGKEFVGTISGVTEWGVYIEEKDTKAEGVVKLRDLGDDYYVLDEKNYRIVGERTKKKYSLGDSVRFRVAGADVERKTLNYEIA